MKATYLNLTKTLLRLQDIPLLLTRLILAYGFYGPAMTKLNDVSAIADWFTSIGIPAPTLNAYLATYTELIGAVFLLSGFATRLITLPLMITMLVAIFTVHWQNGFNASDNGFEIPLYYLVMLITLFFSGAGRLSVDYLISKNKSEKNTDKLYKP